jgi:hypothetical protein
MEGITMSIHAKPFCWAKNKFSARVVGDLDAKMDRPVKCPGCGIPLTGQDVADTVSFGALVTNITISNEGVELARMFARRNT